MGVSALVKKVLSGVGILPERFSLQWASAAEAPRFVKLITEFTQKMQELGPIGEAEGLGRDEIKERIDNALSIVSNRKLRVVFGTATKAIRKEGDFSQAHITDVINSKLSNSVTSGLLEAGLISALEKEPASLTSLVKRLGTKKELAEKILETLSKKGKVSQKGKKWAIAQS